MRTTTLLLLFVIIAWSPAARAADHAPFADPHVLFSVPEAQTQERGRTRLEWGYDFLRRNFSQPVFDASQQRGTRSQHRKTHLVTWRAAYGVTDRLQVESEAVYQAYRQHTHLDGDEHDRNDDGDFERLSTGVTMVLAAETLSRPNLLLRGGVRLPSRADTEDIGQEAGFELGVSTGKEVGLVRLTASTGWAMTFDNHSHPEDPVFPATLTSKGHDLKTVRYGVAASRRLTAHWQANLELAGAWAEDIELNRRVSRTTLTCLPGVLYQTRWGAAEPWVGLGIPIGLTSDTDHLGVAVRTGVKF